MSMKGVERVFEKILCRIVSVDEMQLGLYLRQEQCAS